MTTTKMTKAKANTAPARRREGTLFVALALAGASLLGFACNRQHLSSNYGMSYSAWFTAQHVRHEPSQSEATKRALGGLDAQEAANITKNYRKASSGGQGDGAGQGQMVMIGQTRGGVEGYTPAPSVPAGN
jgi:hypothetical protein